MPFYKKSYIFSLLLLLFVFFTKNVVAAGIDIKDFRLVGNPPKYQVLARVEINLTNYLRKALLNGVTLNARVQFRLGQHRSWWFNLDKPLLTVSYQLKYHALSRHYLLTRNDTNEHWNFSTLPSALRKLGDLRKYNLPEIKVPLENNNYVGYKGNTADRPFLTSKNILRSGTFPQRRHRFGSVL